MRRDINLFYKVEGGGSAEAPFHVLSTFFLHLT